MYINIFDGFPKIKSGSKGNFDNFSELRSRFEEIGDQVILTKILRNICKIRKERTWNIDK